MKYLLFAIALLLVGCANESTVKTERSAMSAQDSAITAVLSKLSLVSETYISEDEQNMSFKPYMTNDKEPNIVNVSLHKTPDKCWAELYFNYYGEALHVDSVLVTTSSGEYVLRGSWYRSPVMRQMHESAHFWSLDGEDVNAALQALGESSAATVTYMGQLGQASRELTKEELSNIRLIAQAYKEIHQNLPQKQL